MHNYYSIPRSEYQRLLGLCIEIVHVSVRLVYLDKISLLVHFKNYDVFTRYDESQEQAELSPRGRNRAMFQCCFALRSQVDRFCLLA